MYVRANRTFFLVTVGWWELASSSFCFFSPCFYFLRFGRLEVGRPFSNRPHPPLHLMCTDFLSAPKQFFLSLLRIRENRARTSKKRKLFFLRKGKDEWVKTLSLFNFAPLSKFPYFSIRISAHLYASLQKWTWRSGWKSPFFSYKEASIVNSRKKEAKKEKAYF